MSVSGLSCIVDDVGTGYFTSITLLDSLWWSKSIQQDVTFLFHRSSLFKTWCLHYPQCNFATQWHWKINTNIFILVFISYVSLLLLYLIWKPVKERVIVILSHMIDCNCNDFFILFFIYLFIFCYVCTCSCTTWASVNQAEHTVRLAKSWVSYAMWNTCKAIAGRKKIHM